MAYSNKARAERWMQRALDPDVHPLPTEGNVYSEGDTIFSFGSHFPMAIVMRQKLNDSYSRHIRPTVGEPRWVLVNGDRYSATTSKHQALVRGVIEESELDYMIVPFSALEAAGINRASIEPLEVRPDRTEEIHRSSPDEPHGGGEVPVWVFTGRGDRRYWEPHPDNLRRWFSSGNGAAELGTDGRWHWVDKKHWLGDAAFRAQVRGKHGRRRFLSSFDYQESTPLYFLCELPRTSKAETVEQAYEDLKPPQVKAAEAQLREVTRQGDMFAIPTTFNTREVKGMTPHGKGRIVKRPRLGLLGTNHTASEVIFATGGRIYARGLLYHNPGAWRQPDHARRKMGDGRTWHLLVKNTVPTETPAPTRERTPA